MPKISQCLQNSQRLKIASNLSASVLFINIIEYLFGIKWITTYNFYTITKYIQITVLGRFLLLYT